MRKQSSNQSRDGRCFRQSSLPPEIRYVTRQLSEERKSSSSGSSRTSRRMDSKTESYFEYVPSIRSHQKQYLTSEWNRYEKPSLPYYVVPVLYVPQKVLSSEEIRPASPLQNKNTVSFLVKNCKQSREGNVEPIDVDDIPCIPCETIKSLNRKKSDYEKEEILVSNVCLDSPYTGYINASYTQSSTSIIEDTDYQDDPISSCIQRKFVNPGHVDYEKVCNYRRLSNKNCNPQVYHHFLEQQKKHTNSSNKIEDNKLTKGKVRLRWNPECNCYEPVEKRSIPDCPDADVCEKVTKRTPVRNKKECLVTKQNLQENKSKKCGFNYDVEEKCYQTRKSTLGNEPKEYHQKYNCPEESCTADYRTCNEETFELEDYSTSSHYQDAFNVIDNCSLDVCRDNQDSTLSCEKSSKIVSEVTSLIGIKMTCESPMHQSRPCKKRSPVDLLTAEEVENTLDDAPSLTVRPKNRRPKESQTTFDDIIIYNRRCRDDVCNRRHSDR